MNIVEKYVDRKIKRFSYLSSCKNLKKETQIEKNEEYPKDVLKVKDIVKKIKQNQIKHYNF